MFHYFAEFCKIWTDQPNDTDTETKNEEANETSQLSIASARELSNKQTTVKHTEKGKNVYKTERS